MRTDVHIVQLHGLQKTLDFLLNSLTLLSLFYFVLSLGGGKVK